MTTPTYVQFPRFTDTGTTALTVVSAVSGILHTVNISSSGGATLVGSVTLKDATSTIQVWGAGTAAGSYLFDVSYAQPLSVQLTNAASDYVTISAGPV